jgi:hypothetical protein
MLRGPHSTVLRSPQRRSRALRVPSAQQVHQSPACALPALHVHYVHPAARVFRAPLATTAPVPASLPGTTPAHPVRSVQQAHPRPAFALPALHARWARPAARVCRAPLATTARVAPSRPTTTPAHRARCAPPAQLPRNGAASMPFLMRPAPAACRVASARWPRRHRCRRAPLAQPAPPPPHARRPA